MSAASTDRAAWADTLWLTQLHDVSVSRLLYTAARLGVPDRIGDGRRDVRELAEEARVDAETLDRVLRPLVALGLFTRDAQGRYANSPASDLLRGSDRAGLADELRLQPEYLAFAEIDRVVRTGRPAFADDGGFYGLLDRNREWADTFRRACQSRSERTYRELLRRHDWDGCDRLLDVGGGVGHHLETVLAVRPVTRGVLLDRPAGIELARQRPWASDVAERVEFVAGDYTAELPRADTALLVNVVHNLDDDAARELLRAVRVRAGCTRLVIGEYVLPDDPAEPHPGALADVWMLVVVGGRERGRGAFEELLTSAGWTLGAITEDPVTRGALLDCRVAP